jgi:toxin ParE1/3/4
MAAVVWTASALDDLDAICGAIARETPRYAGVLATRIFRAVEQLEDLPRAGRVVPELGRADVREVFVQSYRVIYRVAEDSVQILGVRHGARMLKDVHGL